MKNFLSKAALALMGAMMTGCSSNDNFDNPQQPENKSKVVTLTTTVGFDASAGTRALTETGVKTFAVGDQIVLFYKDGNGLSRRVVSSALTAMDITNEGKKANLTFDVSAAAPAADGAIRYVYPANMASTNQDSNFDLDDEHTIDFSKLNNQDGTLTTLGSSLDLCVFDGNFSGTSLPTSATLTNQLAILAINLKNTTDITSTITDMTISDGTNTYAVSRSAAAGPIYVAIQPVASQNIEVTATDGTDEYVKTLSGKTYAANNGYNVTWNMTKLPKVTWNSTNVINESHEDDCLDYSSKTPLTYEDITISLSGTNSGFYPYNYYSGYAVLNCSGNYGDSFTFTAPSGKKFTKIEIINNSNVTFTAYGDWTKPVNTKIVWRGTPASTVTLGGSNWTYANELTSIVFTLKDE